MYVEVINMIPHSLSGEDRMDSEPNITVNPANPRHMAASAFTPDPLLSGNAPIYDRRWTKVGAERRHARRKRDE